ncbi:hypothetical protein XENTR_v10004908 [Xenopus tropicalis]|uniref:Claudin 8, gene 3 n=1 Tax=Xenopus tropicalis TaxID=8364 RepID=A0A803K8Z6_XENTR|nr:claudin-8 [Xenopus tropicalis]KAE8621651.1 hypothetical protein XENTR_v10004908 [Xenopus tropicalis]|eukprot:XP_002938484.1 PREDICTED: claudin-8-like [Xenopus tropicalis]
MAMKLAGLVLGGLGFVGTCAVTGMPQWRVTAFIDSNIVVFEAHWEGLWMNCIRQANIRMQCKIYDSLLALPPDLEAGRMLMCVAICLTFLAFMISIFGINCTGFILLIAGIIFILSGIIVLVPVSWVGYRIIQDFYNPLVHPSQKRELGEALYIGWTTALVLIAGGIILCCSFQSSKKEVRYSLPPESVTSVPPPESVTSVPPPESVTSAPPPESVTSVPPPQSVTSVPPPESVTSAPPPESVTSVSPPESVTSVPPPESVTNVPPLESVTSVPPPESVTSVPLQKPSSLYESQDVLKGLLSTDIN